MNFAEYHRQAAPILQQNLQVGVIGYHTLCSCLIKGKQCEITFKGKPHEGNPQSWLCEEAIVNLSIPGAPKTPQTHQRFVVTISPHDDLSSACARVSEAILKVTGVNKIIVKKQGELWRATLEHKPGVSETGKTHLEAIGELLMSNPEQFGVEVIVS